MFLYFFFFKQKTAYEMRISDWSSDVCSSDLPSFMLLAMRQTRQTILDDDHGPIDDQTEVQRTKAHQIAGDAKRVHPHRHHQEREGNDEHRDDGRRSEEHTSELQSLMRISYAVFCLKKKKHNHTNKHTYKK